MEIGPLISLFPEEDFCKNLRFQNSKYILSILIFFKQSFFVIQQNQRFRKRGWSTTIYQVGEVFYLLFSLHKTYIYSSNFVCDKWIISRTQVSRSLAVCLQSLPISRGTKRSSKACRSGTCRSSTSANAHNQMSYKNAQHFPQFYLLILRYLKSKGIIFWWRVGNLSYGAIQSNSTLFLGTPVISNL